MGLTILLSSYACDPTLGSEPGKGWNIACELARHETVWVLTSPKGRSAIERALKLSGINTLNFLYVNHSPVERIIEALPWGHYWNALSWQERAYGAARTLDERVKFDVVHHVSYGSIHIGSRLWRLGHPFVFGPVGGGQTTPSGFARHLKGGRVSEAIRTFIARHLAGYLFNAKSTVRAATVVLAANRDTFALATALGARDLRAMVDSGIASNQIRSSAREHRLLGEPLRILWVGRLLPRKGLLLALEAVSSIHTDIAWTLKIVGDGPQRRLLPEWLLHLQLESKVSWSGEIPWKDVQATYDNADVFLFTSLRDTTGVQVLEALGKGLPVVTLNHHGAGEVVPDSAGFKIDVLTPKETATAIARAIERLAADAKLISRMSEAAIYAARRHTWERKAADFIRIYRDVTADGPAQLREKPGLPMNKLFF